MEIINNFAATLLTPFYVVLGMDQGLYVCCVISHFFQTPPMK